MRNENQETEAPEVQKELGDGKPKGLSAEESGSGSEASPRPADQTAPRSEWYAKLPGIITDRKTGRLHVSVMYFGEVPPEEDAAGRILQAVNSHEAAVAALKVALAIISAEKFRGGLKELVHETLRQQAEDEVRAALALALGGSRE